MISAKTFPMAFHPNVRRLDWRCPPSGSNMLATEAVWRKNAMEKKHLILSGVAIMALAASLIGGGLSAQAQDKPFGNPEDLAYAEKLWAALEEIQLAGPDAMHSNFYEGVEPHGFVLEVFDAKVKVDDYTGRVIVKTNYGPEGVAVEEVSNDPSGHLAAVTVMFRREAGYDEENKNWFWAKYLPDGTLDKNPAGMQLAGRVAKGADEGCIACHSAAPGEDYLFVNDRAD